MKKIIDTKTIQAVLHEALGNTSSNIAMVLETLVQAIENENNNIKQDPHLVEVDNGSFATIVTDNTIAVKYLVNNNISLQLKGETITVSVLASMLVKHETVNHRRLGAMLTLATLDGTLTPSKLVELMDEFNGKVVTPAPSQPTQQPTYTQPAKPVQPAVQPVNMDGMTMLEKAAHVASVNGVPNTTYTSLENEPTIGSTNPDMFTTKTNPTDFIDGPAEVVLTRLDLMNQQYSGLDESGIPVTLETANGTIIPWRNFINGKGDDNFNLDQSLLTQAEIFYALDLAGEL